MLDLFSKKTTSIIHKIFYMNIFLNYKSLQCEKIDPSERIDINKSNKLKDCVVCHYLHFKDIGYKFDPCVCNKLHDISMMTYELGNIAILKLNSV